jgi:hypothetical protein
MATTRPCDLFQGIECRERCLLDGICDADDAGGLIVDGHEHPRRAVLAKPLGALLQRRRINAETLQEGGIADGNMAAIDKPDNATSGWRVERGGIDEAKVAGCCGRNDCGGERMFARPLQARR